MTSPTPTAVPDTPFQALDAAHQKIMEHLADLAKLVDHMERHGDDAHARAEAGRIEHFFSTTSRQHHLDEESQVFPGLLATGNADLVAAVNSLQQDHGWIEEDWIILAPQLRAVASGQGGNEPEELRHTAQVFLELCHEHIALEESLIYPQAKALAMKFNRQRQERVKAAAPSSS